MNSAPNSEIPSSQPPVNMAQNQVPNQSQPEPKANWNWKLIVTIVLILVLIGGSIAGYYYYTDWAQKDRIAKRASADKQITDLIYKVRDDARFFYQANQSYKEWWPQSKTLVEISKLGSTAIYRKPDFQSFIVYAYSETDQQYFCVDSRGFADFVERITDEQIKCN